MTASPEKNSSSGMSLVELVITLGVVSLALFVFVSTAVLFQRRQNTQMETVEQVSETLATLQFLRKDLLLAQNIEVVTGSLDPGFKLTQNGIPTDPTFTYTLHSNATCVGANRKPFPCVEFRREDAASNSMQLAQFLSFQWCAETTWPSPQALGPDCAALDSTVIPRPSDAPRPNSGRFFGTATVPLESGGSRTLKFVFAIDGHAAAGKPKLLRSF